MTHPLDRPVWAALTSRHAGFALGGGAARRYRPEAQRFAAAADATPGSLDALAALVAPGERLALLEVGEAAPPARVRSLSSTPVVQLIWGGGAPPSEPLIDALPLAAADAEEMAALAALTQPGPFVAESWRLGPFLGVRRAGRLVAMAGERLAPPGHAEISGVCTHPDARGAGLARGLIAAKIAAVLARGETPFLHAHADNDGAIALYERLGFRRRATLTLRWIAREDDRG